MDNLFKKKCLFRNCVWEIEVVSIIAFRVQVRPVQVECVHAIVEHLRRKNDEIICLITKWMDSCLARLLLKFNH